MNTTKNRTLKLTSAIFREPERASSVMRAGRAHGPSTSKYTGLPRHDAAVTRSGVSRAHGATPVHSTLESNGCGETQRDEVSVNAARSRPARENSGSQLGAA